MGLSCHRFDARKNLITWNMISLIWTRQDRPALLNAARPVDYQTDGSLTSFSGANKVKQKEFPNDEEAYLAKAGGVIVDRRR